jgi:predicted lactoylglutathione lyase
MPFAVLSAQFIYLNKFFSKVVFFFNTPLRGASLACTIIKKVRQVLLAKKYFYKFLSG